MPDKFASSLAAFRSDERYSPRVYLSVYAPAAIVVAAVSVVLPDPVKAITVSVTSGDWTDIRAGMRAVFYSAGGAYKGETRIRYGNTITDTVFPIRETALASVNIEAGDTVKIFPYIPLDTKVVEATEQFAPDGTPVGTFGSNPPPLVCSGGHTVGWVDSYYSATPGTFRTVSTDGSNTRNVDPDSGSDVNHDWSFPFTAGADFASGSAATDESPVLELDTGLHLVQHDAEDDDNSVTGVQYTAHIVHDSTFLPYEVVLSQPPQGDDQYGWSWEVELFDELDLEDCPDGALCMLWADEWIDGDYGSVRSAVSGRSHILGIGYARRDTSAGDGVEGERLTLEIQSPLARLNEIASYSKVMEENATPDAWNEIKTLGVERAIVQLVQFYTTLTEAGFDLITHALFSDARYPAFYLQRSDPIGQIRELAIGRQARLVNTERGAYFELQPHPGTLGYSDRASVEITITLTDDDAFSYEYPREHFDSIEILELRGITAGASGNTAVFSRAPSLAPGGGSQAAVQERRIPDSQTQANVWAGLEWALAENLFYDPANDYQKHRVGELTLRLPGVYGVFDFGLEYVRFQYDGSLRGIDFTDYRFYLKRFTSEVDPDSGEWTTVVTLQAEMYALPGATFVPPDGGAGVGDGQPPPWAFPPVIPTPVGGTMISGGTGRLLTLDVANSLFYTETANSASPTWVEVALSLTGTVVDFVPDPFCSRYLGTGTVVGLYVATTTRIYYVEFDVSDFSVTETELATLTATSFGLRRIETERADEGFVVCVYTTNPGGATESVAATDGATFGSPVTLNASGGSNYGTPGLYVSGRATGKAFTSETTTGAATDGLVTTNSGVSFGDLSSPNIDSAGGAFSLHIPYHDNAAETIAYFGSWAGVGQPRKILRASGSGAATDISPSDGGESWGAQLVRSIDTCPINRMRVAASLRNGDQAGDPTDNVRVYYSLNGGTTWSYIAALDGGNGVGSYWTVRCAGDDPNIFWALGEDGRIVKCNFSGQYQNLHGNLTTLGAGWLVNIAGF